MLKYEIGIKFVALKSENFNPLKKYLVMRRCNTGAVVGGFLAGALVGGVVALLFAPRSGAETRGMIRDYVDDKVDAVKDKAAAARDFVEEEIDRYKSRVRHAAHEIAEAKEKIADEIAATKRASRTSRTAKTAR